MSSFCYLKLQISTYLRTCCPSAWQCRGGSCHGRRWSSSCQTWSLGRWRHSSMGEFAELSILGIRQRGPARHRRKVGSKIDFVNLCVIKSKITFWMVWKYSWPSSMVGGGVAKERRQIWTCSAPNFSTASNLFEPVKPLKWRHKGENVTSDNLPIVALVQPPGAFHLTVWSGHFENFLTSLVGALEKGWVGDIENFASVWNFQL